jgi:hypothetical protein
MSWWPGWDSIESTDFWNTFYFWFGILCLLLLGISEVVSHYYGERHSILVAAADRVTIENRDQQQKKAEERHASEVAKLEQQLRETSNQVAEDHGLKARIRNLFASIDPQILRAIDGGATNLIIRMQPSDIDNLRKLTTEPDAATLVRIIEISGARMYNSQISNGTLGPQNAVPVQMPVEIAISRGLAITY